MTGPIAVVLAAGRSTRMESTIPKVLHPVCGPPLVDYVLAAARSAGVARIVVVIGHEAAQVRDGLSHHRDVSFAMQSEQKGTGHAVMMCESELSGHDGPVLILAGDTPLLRARSLVKLLDDLKSDQASCVIGTADTEFNKGLGRIVRDSAGSFVKIVEQQDATPRQAAITEINTGCYAFDCGSLLRALRELRPDNRQAEYYLTDCPAIMRSRGEHVVASCNLTIEEAMGVNTRVQLAEVRRVIQQKFLQTLMLDGVTIVDPDQTSIDTRASIGRDTTVFPFTSVCGPARIGAGCRIGPNAVIDGDVTVANGTNIGPFQVVRG